MKTTHQLAKELLALPDVPLEVEGWCGGDIIAKMTRYDPEGTAILVEPREPMELDPSFKWKFVAESLGA